MKQLLKIVLIFVVAGMIGVLFLHLFPSLEDWLHEFTGWY